MWGIEYRPQGDKNRNYSGVVHYNHVQGSGNVNFLSVGGNAEDLLIQNHSFTLVIEELNEPFA